MRKLHLATLVTMAVLFFFLQCRVEADRQIDMLQFLPAKFKSYMIGEVKKEFSEKCKKAAEGVENSTIIQDFENGTTELETCIGGLAQTLYSNKDCNDGFKCLLDFNKKVQPCFSAKERQQNVAHIRIVTGLLDFMCSMNSSHVMQDEEIRTCFQDKNYAVNACFYKSFHFALPKDIKIPNFFDLYHLVMEPSLCVEWEYFQSCSIQQLEQCREKAPASVDESVFKIIKNVVGCNQDVNATAPKNAVNLMLSSEVGEVQTNFREKCVKAAKGVENSTIIQDFENGITELETCIGGLAQKLYTNKDCNYGFKCLLDFNKKVQPCFSAKERQQNVEHIPIVTGMVDFMCSMNSSHVMQDEEIRTCFNNSFHFALPKDIKIPNFFDLYTLVMEPSLCVEWENFQSCTIKQLEQFRENAKASVDESVFKIIKNVMGCNQDVNATAPKNAMNLSSDVVGEPIAKNMISFNHNGADTAPKNAMNLMLSSGVMLLVSRLLKM